MDSVDEAEVATEVAEAVDVADEDQNGTKRRNGFLLQNLVVLCAPGKSSQWRYVFDNVIVWRTNAQEIYLHSLPIKEYQIVDYFLPKLKDEVMKVGSRVSPQNLMVDLSRAEANSCWSTYSL